VEVGVEGVFNVLRDYGFLDGTPERGTQVRATGFEQYGSPAGGLVDFEFELGDRVTAGDTLFTVTDAFGRTKDEVTAESSGVFWRTRRLPQVATGEYVCSLGTDLKEY
ncbi:MAG: succinylglutamate desuccinylase/aspartoacylase family protein, partial [Halobacteriales archaeon]